MLHEFAVDPECMPTFDSLQRITDQCAFHLGRFVSDFPRRTWAVRVRDKLNIQKQGFRVQQHFTDLVAQLVRRGGLVDTARRYDSNRTVTWLDNAVREHSGREFHAIITDSNPNQHEYILVAGEITPQTDRWNVEPEDRVPRTSASLTACVKPLFQLSREILFADGHFTPDTSRYQHALQDFLIAAHEGGRTYKRLEYHTKVQVKDGATKAERDKWIGSFHKDCLARIPRVVPRGVRLRIVLWAQKTGGDEFHARYVITERGAIRIDKGLDFGEPGQTTDICLVAPSVYQERWNDLQPGATTYDFIESIDIIGTRRP